MNKNAIICMAVAPVRFHCSNNALLGCGRFMGRCMWDEVPRDVDHHESWRALGVIAWRSLGEKRSTRGMEVAKTVKIDMGVVQNQTTRDRRSWSLFPFAKVPFWVHVFDDGRDDQSAVAPMHSRIQS